MTVNETCEHEDTWFSREVCACGQMHYYCANPTCGALADFCELVELAAHEARLAAAGRCVSCEVEPATTTCGVPQHPCALCKGCRSELDGTNWDDAPGPDDRDAPAEPVGEGRVEIGRVCYKGPHLSLVGETDFGVCGSHDYARIYVTLEEDYPNPRGEVFTAQEAADEIARVVREHEAITERAAWDAEEWSPDPRTLLWVRDTLNGEGGAYRLRQAIEAAAS